ncbi:hypothetical protein [Chitinophaga sp. sic0106]|uniref:hypothetical protein n=1 Tax=Chitinophaga sp. sic0106 TaxID=2854785 RepID=UPI001C45F097|nr:hypothetical protein [Chitinophaga sp. sic0106]MBV7529274.1 hypothetical protein [Chitinophaga sp. sic0106]
MMDSETLIRLQDISNSEWEAIFKELVLYAEFKLKKAGLSTRFEADSEAGAVDFVQEAIKRVFEGRRRWDFHDKPDIRIFLKHVVKSLIGNHFKQTGRIEVNSQRRSQVVVSGRDMDYLTNLPDDDLPDEEIEVANEVWAELETAFGNDEEYLIFIEFLEGKKPRDLSVEYSKDISDIYNIIKKGKRYCISIKNKIL